VNLPIRHHETTRKELNAFVSGRGSVMELVKFRHTKPVIEDREPVANADAAPDVKPTLDLDDAVEPQPISTFNSTLDSQQNYCTVDLLHHIDDNHLLKRLSRQRHGANLLQQ